MTNIYIKCIFVLLLSCLLISCASSHDKPDPYWLKLANEYSANGVSLYERQRYKASSVEFMRAYNAYQRFDYVKGTSQSLLNLAKVEIAQRNYVQANTYLHKLDLLILDNNFTNLSVHVDIMRSSIAINENNLKLALEIIGKYIPVNGNNQLQLDNELYMALLTNRLRLAFMKKQDIDNWINTYSNHAGEDSLYQARLYRFKGQQAGFLSDVKNINLFFSNALEVYRSEANPGAVLLTHKEWAEALKANNKLADAAIHLETVYTVAKLAQNEYESTNALNLLLEIYMQLDDTDNAARINHLLMN